MTSSTPAADAPSVASVQQAEPVFIESQPVAITATSLALHSSRGVVYGPVDLEARTGALTVIQGPQGAGRSSLLLTLAGRMVPDRGSRLTVLGFELPRERRSVQRRAALAGFRGIDDLDQSATVRETVHERLAWLSPWYRRTPPVTPELLASRGAVVYGNRPLPQLNSMIWDLDEVDVMLLRVTVAMMQDPEPLVVDDIDQVHDTQRRQFVWSRLEAIAASGVAVVATVASLDEVSRMTWQTPPDQIFLSTGPHALTAA